MDSGPSISADGLELYFSSSNRPGGYGGWDLWVTTRATKDDPWGTPVNLGPTINTEFAEWSASISADGLTLFFSDYQGPRPGGYGDVDIWVTMRATVSDAWGTPMNLGPPVNGLAHDGWPGISPDGSTLFFASNRLGGYGSADMWQVSILPVVDFNGDGIVDSADMYILLDHWGGNLPLCDIGPTPLGDGIVDVHDLIVFSEHVFEDFFYIPVRAREPDPDSGTTDVDLDVVLSWGAGRQAAQHNVYLSSDEQAVIDGTASVTTVTETSYGPLSLDFGTTYYWRVDEVNEAEPPITLDGNIWNFTTCEYLVVEDFELYNDNPPNEIYTTWEDGYADPVNGAQVGNISPPLVETTIVHGGDQAMPFFYSNTGVATYSEGERTFAVPQDWTAAGIQTLALYFHGTAGNTGQLYVKVNGIKVPYSGEPGNLTVEAWQRWDINLASLGVNLQSVTTLTIGIEGNGATGTLFVDDIRLYQSAP